MKRPLRVVIAGTGTGVGKTYVTQRLTCALTDSGVGVAALKPIETGYVDPHASDAYALSRSACHSLTPPLFTARLALGPLRAALLEGQKLVLAQLASWLEAAERELTPRVTLIETAGGLFSPLTPTATNLDLISRCQPERWILVAQNRLGALHDVLAVRTALRAEQPDAILLNDTPPGGPASNADDLRLCGVENVYSDVTELALLLRRWLEVHEEPAPR